MKKISGVFWFSVAILLIAVAYGVAAPKNFESITSNIEQFITLKFGWYYLILVSILVIFCVFLILSPIGSITLGKPNEKPEYSTISWFSMLFSAGMGIGLVFWGAAEPLSHFATNSPLAEPGSDAALKDALRFTFFHWGLHAWGIYALIALALAYFNFRKGEPGLISATLSPLLGKYSTGTVAGVIDVLGVLATVIGVATTLGFGAAQINGGLSFLFHVPNNFSVQLIIIVIVTILFIISSWSGLGKGIKYLSNANLILATALLILMFIAGPTLLTLNLFTDTIGSYLQNIIQMSFRTAPLNHENREWINSWTIFYWAWWISWSPFVGIFIARVSKGRTIRQFLIGVLLAPSIVSFIWFSIFGTASINVQKQGFNLTTLKTEEILFGMFEHVSMTTILSVIAVILICVFFITSADSATFVLGMQTTYGSLTPPNSVKLTWGVLQSLVAVILLYSGGLQGLQNALIIAAFPFSIIIILMTFSLYKSLMKERNELRLYVRAKPLKKKLETNHD